MRIGIAVMLLYLASADPAADATEAADVCSEGGVCNRALSAGYSMLQANRALMQAPNLTLAEEEESQIPYFTNRNKNNAKSRIICPFLAALVREDVLPVKESYTRAELQAITIQAGLPAEMAAAHVEGNFKDIPGQKIDLWNMEGMPDEHITSTGINDCETHFHDAAKPCVKMTSGPHEGSVVCKTDNIRCGVPNLQKFNEFWEKADADGDGKLTISEAQKTSDLYDGNNPQLAPVDVHPEFKGAVGTLGGSMEAIVTIFGRVSGNQRWIGKGGLRELFMKNKFPGYYTFPA